MEEHFDVCSPEGVPDGRIRPRSQVHAEGLWHRSAHLWLTDGAGQVLLQQRHPGKQTDPGRWDIAVAGHLSAGQTPRQAVVREALEELGLTLDPDHLVWLGAWRQEYDDGDFHDREWQHVFAAVWQGDPATLRLQADEVVAAAWQPWPVYRDAVRALDPAYVDRRDDLGAFAAWAGLSG